MNTMFANAKGYKLRASAEKKLAAALQEIPLQFYWSFIISKDDGTYLPVIKLENTDTHWMRPLIDRGICVTN